METSEVERYSEGQCQRRTISRDVIKQCQGSAYYKPSILGDGEAACAGGLEGALTPL
jgi:hypothetical protein